MAKTAVSEPTSLQSEPTSGRGARNAAALLSPVNALGLKLDPASEGARPILAQVIAGLGAGEAAVKKAADKVRNALSRNGALKAAMTAEAAAAGYTHVVTAKGGRYGVRCHVPADAVDHLRALGMDVVKIGPQTPPDGHDGPGGGETPDTSADTNDTNDANRDAPTAPALTVQHFTDPAAARAAHMMRDALGMAELIAAGSNDLEMVGFEPDEAEELLEMAREIVRKRRKSL